MGDTGIGALRPLGVEVSARQMLGAISRAKAMG